MKILHVTHGYHPESRGGVESYLCSTLHAQRSAGHDAVLVTGSFEPWPEAGVERLDVDGIPVHRVHRDDVYFDHFAKFYHPGVEQIFKALLASERPDVVHVHQRIRLTCNLVEICAEASLPAVVTLHDVYTSCPRCFRVRPGDETCSRPLSVESCLDCVPRFGHESDRELRESIELYRDQYRAEIGMASAVLVPSAAAMDLICESTGVEQGRIEVLPLGYEARFPGRVAPVPLPADTDAFRFGYWGNLSVLKGVRALLQAFRELVQDGIPRPTELHLFGPLDDDGFRTELEEVAAGLPVFFHGEFQHADVASARLHMAVFPTLCFETHGFVLDECFELGIPCIVTDIGAIPVRAGGAALRVAPNDPGGLAAAMRRVLERPELRDELGRAIPDRGPPVDAHLARLEEVYERARSGAIPSPGERVPAWRRARFLLWQRESALGQIAGEPR